jgi:mono/diheme cytochrome c family protein
MCRLVTAIALTLASACSKDSQPPPGQDSQLLQAQATFNTKCARCHGINGNGKGPFSDSLLPKPQNYTDPVWQASVTDDEIKEIILRGGINMGKSPAMPGIPTLKNRPEELEGLVKLIRSFGERP